jgi:MFS family permease
MTTGVSLVATTVGRKFDDNSRKHGGWTFRERAGTGLYLWCVRFHLRHNGSGRIARFLLIAVLVQAVLGFLCVMVAEHPSDRIGSKRMYMIGCVFVAVFGVNYFARLNTKLPALIFVAVALSGLPITTMYGPKASPIAEPFSPRLRYSGSSLGYQLASIIAGGPSPFSATGLLAFLRFELSDCLLHPGLRR